MKKISLYSKSSRPPPREMATAPADMAQETAKPRLGARALAGLRRHERPLLVACAVLLSALLYVAYMAIQPAARPVTQRDIDAAVLHTLEHKMLPSPEAKAFSIVQRSVVRVSQSDGPRGDAASLSGIGTGVVIIDQGVILTNLHVVEGAERIEVQFADGSQSDAVVLSTQPENDLAVLQALNIPDDLVPATLRSTQDLALGDHVIAVGFPFGIGPSVSSGIVSGLHRNYQSPEGEHVLANLIQFDAAANPGNSGGPLVTMDGEVVGIVTAILNPSEQGTFIGIGFAVPIENAATAVGESPF